MSFGMFGGEKTGVKIAFKNELVGVFLDRFGREIMIHPSKKEGWSETSVQVSVSDQFFGWVFALGSGVKIISPQKVVDRFKTELENTQSLYD